MATKTTKGKKGRRPTVRLTKRTVDALAPEASAYIVWDAQLTGFGCRVWPSGKKVFLVFYRPRHASQMRYLTLGEHGAVTATEARDLAKIHLGAVAKGADPARERQAARGAPTVRDAGETYLAWVDAKRKPTTATEYRRMWERHVVPALGREPVATVSRRSVEKLHLALSESPYLANRVLAMLGAFFTWAMKNDVRPEGVNPAHHVDFYPEAQRERYLTPAEFKRLGAALEKAEREGLPPAPRRKRTAPSAETAKHTPKSAGQPLPANPRAIAAIRLLALTGCRVSEILSLRWEEVDVANGYLRLGDSKTGQSLRPLTQSAAALLDSLERDEGSPWVLPGAKRGEHLKDIDRLWEAVRHAAQLEDVRLHDLRHSFGAVSTAAGQSMFTLSKMLGHRRLSTTARYSHLGDDPLREAANRTADTIAGMLTPAGGQEETGAPGVA